MKDIQNLTDHRKINIQKVGVKNISYPIVLQDKAQLKQHTVASVNMYCNLPHHFKGTHMSRFVEILNDFHGNIDMNSFQLILERMKNRLEAEAAHLSIQFPFFIEKRTGSGAKRVVRYECSMHGSLDAARDMLLNIEIPISLQGSNEDGGLLSTKESGTIKIGVRFHHFIWIEDLIMVVESTIDEIYSEDRIDDRCLSVDFINSEVAKGLERMDGIRWFQVATEKEVNGYTAFAISHM